MKGISSDFRIAPKAERPFPEREIIWGSQDGGQPYFPTLASAYERLNSAYPTPLQKFGRVVSEAQERIWVVDEYLLMPDKEKGNPGRRIDEILSWLPEDLAASDIRLLTRNHREVNQTDVNKLLQQAQKINRHNARRHKECRIEIRTHLTIDCNFIHDRFAIIDDELWHFGATVGGFHSKVSAASRGWRAVEHGAIQFFEDIWNKGQHK